MKRLATTVSTSVAHLVGPGKVRIMNGRLAFVPLNNNPLRLDLDALRTLLCYGNVSISDDALNSLLSHDIAMACMTPLGNRCHGRLVGPDIGPGMFRVAQYCASVRPSIRLSLARAIVADKLISMLQMARRIQRHGGTGATFATSFLSILHDSQSQVANAMSLESLRGHEGFASRAWFELLSKQLRPPFVFTGRNRRPPTDPVNSLLSLGYTLTFARVLTRIQAAGLEPTLGMLHEYHPGRASLACDLIEPLRVPMVDRWMLKQCNQGAVKLQHFTVHPDGGMRLIPDQFPHALAAWEEHWQDHKGVQQLDLIVNRFTQQLRALSRDDIDEVLKESESDSV